MTVRSMHVITVKGDWEVLRRWWAAVAAGQPAAPPCREALSAEGQRVLDFAVRVRAAYEPSAVARLRVIMAAAGAADLEDPYALAFAAAAFQVTTGILVVDGVPGARTAAALAGTSLAATSRYLLFGGQRMAAPFAVTPWMEPGGMDLRRFHGGQRQRADVRMLMLHWDGCLTSRQCFQVLLERELSVQFLVDADGTVYQTADVLSWCYHGGVANRYSVGVEICNPVRLERQALEAAGVQRPVLTEREPHSGRQVTHLGFTPAQHVAVRRLVDWFCGAFMVPRRAPDLVGAVYGTDDPARVASGLAPAVVAGDFAGIVGHFHASTNKVDPGFSLWPSVLQPEAR